MKNIKSILKFSLIIAVILNLAELYAAKPGSKSSCSIVYMAGGYYTPLFKEGNTKKQVFIHSFNIDKYPVTNGEYLKFVKANPQWRKSTVKKLFSDKNYLRNWKSDLELHSKSEINKPVTNISWFAANAYCKWIGKRLPTVNEWEYVFIKENNICCNSVSGLYEWTFDFNDTDFEMGSTCGGAGSGTNNPKNYDAFIRFGFRSSLKANYSLSNLTFRCVSGANQTDTPQNSIVKK